MALSDSHKCWDTPSTCGHDYKFMSVGRRLLIARAACPPGYKVVKTKPKEKKGG